MFDSAIDAIREVKLQRGETGDEIFLVWDELGDEYYVFDNEYSVEELIKEDYYDNACEMSVEDQADAFHVYMYCDAEYRDRWSSLYRSYKRSLFDKNTIRGKRTVDGEVIADFTLIL